jgi:hypothetical protein
LLHRSRQGRTVTAGEFRGSQPQSVAAAYGEPLCITRRKHLTSLRNHLCLLLP